MRDFRKTSAALSLVFGCVPVLVMLGGCSSMGGNPFAPSDKAVIAQADQVHAQLAPAVIKDPDVERYMNAIGARIVQGAQDFNKDPEKKDDKHNKQDNAWL